MINCPFELVDGKWKCPDCGWIYSLEAQEKPPKRNCPRGPKDIDRVLAIVARRLKNTAAAMAPATEAKIRTCYECDRFGGQACTERGSECNHFERWIERLMFGRCEAWASHVMN